MVTGNVTQTNKAECTTPTENPFPFFLCVVAPNYSQVASGQDRPAQPASIPIRPRIEELETDHVLEESQDRGCRRGCGVRPYRRGWSNGVRRGNLLSLPILIF